MRRSLLVPPQPAEATWQRPLVGCQEVVGSAERALGSGTLGELLGLSVSASLSSAEQSLGCVVRKVK